MDNFPEQIVPSARSNNIYQGVPTLVQSLSCGPSSIDHPTAVVLGPQCTLILTSDGNIFLLGKSGDGLLGLGTSVTYSSVPRKISIPKWGIITNSDNYNDAAFVTSLSVGLRHASCVTRDGNVYAWGITYNGILGVSPASTGESVIWRPQRVKAFDTLEGDGAFRVCAGSDSTIFMMNNGMVYSCGRKSGRLGQGKMSQDVWIPKPMFGGLRLWHDREVNTDENRNKNTD